MTIGVVGLGNLGSAIANLIAANGNSVIGWEHDARVVEEINRDHLNARFLPGVALDMRLAATGDIEQVVRGSEVLFVALPSVFILPVLGPVAGALGPRATVVNMAKGIDRATGLTAFQTIQAMFPHNRTVMLSGPSIAAEFARGQPTVVVLAGQRTTDLLQIAPLLDNDSFRVRFSDDAVGVELGGVLKNAYVIGLGLFDGARVDSVNFRSVYLTLALEEMTRLGVAMGARAETFAYLSGLGDLLATAMSQASHNRRLGALLAAGSGLGDIEQAMGVLPEGYNTIQMLLLIAEKLHVPAPLAKGLWDVISGRYSAERFIYAFIRDFVE